MLVLFASAALGTLAGAASLVLFPRAFIRNRIGRWANVVVAPVVVGVVVHRTGTWRGHRGGRWAGLTHFACGFTFALAVALVRLIYAQ
jgi:hypothetical protein